MTQIKMLILMQFVVAILLQGCATTGAIPVSTDAANKLRVYIFNCGENDIDDISMFAPGVAKNTKKKLVVSCYVIQHPKGNLLWDAGLSDEIAKSKDGITARGGVFHLRVKQPFLAQLAAAGLSPADFKYIAFSHFHSDHVGNANAFAGSTLLIQQEEADAAFGATPEKFSFDPKLYEKLAAGPMIKLVGDHDVFGDGSVVIKRSTGHTPGHQSLFVNLPMTGPVLISGDLYHFTENRELKRVPTFNFDKQDTEKSMTSIESFVREKHAVMWISHDYEQNQSLRHAPQYYE